eukprot:11157984-Alexandrium_andersonii.AAC.1
MSMAAGTEEASAPTAVDDEAGIVGDAAGQPVPSAVAIGRSAGQPVGPAPTSGAANDDEVSPLEDEEPVPAVVSADAPLVVVSATPSSALQAPGSSRGLVSRSPPRFGPRPSQRRQRL